MISIDLDNNLQFYNSYVPCDCASCKNFCSQIRSVCSDLSNYFEQYGIDIEKPFELVALECGNEIEYVSCQYLIFGECSDDFELKLGNIILEKEYQSYPSTDNYAQPNFVLTFSITLPYLNK